MAFKEKLKKEVRIKSDGCCVICHKPFVEIHHIKPQEEGGADTFDNAAALCARCHDIYGANPTKRKQIKEKRDSWYQMVEAKKTSKIIERNRVYEKIKIVHKAKPKSDKKIAVYHVVYANEGFNEAVNALVELTKKTRKTSRDKRRYLYLDIEGHRLADGAFDHDMWELQYNFIAQYLIHYYAEVHMPLATLKNEYEQLEYNDDDEFKIYEQNEVPDDLKKYQGSVLCTKMTKEELEKNSS